MSRRDTYGSGRRPKFNIGNIVGDPFALATVSTAIIGWIIAFAGSVLAKIGDKESVPNYTWWTVGSLLCCIIGVSVTVAYNTIFTYHVAIVGFLAACLVFTTSSVNSFVYSEVAAKQAAAAGFILLSMIVIVWIFYFGSQPTASHRHVIGSLAMNKDSRIMSPSSRNPPASFRPETAISQQQPQMYTSAQLSGFETSSPVTGYPGGAVGDNRRNSEARFGTPSAVNQPATSLLAPNGGMPDRPESTGGPTEYPYRARAIYSYEADPADANEISFTKNEILDVSDVSGRWWQAKKSNGETGIAPSNYLILM